MHTPLSHRAADIRRLITVGASQGVALTHQQAEDAWSSASDASYGVGWHALEAKDMDVWATLSLGLDVQRLVTIASQEGVTLTPSQAFEDWEAGALSNGHSWCALDADDAQVWSDLSTFHQVQSDKALLKDAGMDPYYLYDCRFLVDTAAQHGKTITLVEAYRAWTAYSETWAAGWLSFTHADVWEAMEPHLS